MPKIGLLEVIVVAQTVLPALMFIPALLPIRFLTRVISFLLPLIAWAVYSISGRKVAGGRPYAAAVPLALAMGWLAVSIFHPNVNTLNSAVCSLGITAGVCCPAFWAPAAIVDGRQLRRLLVLMLLCNGASAVMGIAQVYRPDTFRPPRVPMLELNPELEGSLMVKTDDGREFLRPTGLTDTPGGAAIGGVAACGFGLAMALASGAWWKRLGSLGLALVGLTIMFYSQVRSLTITLVLGIVVWAILLLLRRDFRKLTTLLACVGLIGVVAIGWVLRDGGAGVLERFGALFEDRATTVFYKNRGGFIEYALNEQLPRFPLGAGPGRVGVPSAMFGNRLAPPDRAILYAETQVEIWIYDGGIPMLLLYPLALFIALGSAARTAVTCPDGEVAYCAGAVIVYAITIMTAALAGQPFMSPMGVQFWTLMGAVYGAQEYARVAALKAARAAPP